MMLIWRLGQGKGALFSSNTQQQWQFMHSALRPEHVVRLCYASYLPSYHVSTPSHVGNVISLACQDSMPQH